MNEEIISMLKTIAANQAALIAKQDELDTKLNRLMLIQGCSGLTDGRRFIYIQNTKRSLWSFIADDEPVKAVALTGTVIDLYRKDDDVPKLHVVMQTREGDYVLCSGFETHFSRDIMAAIAQLTPEQAKYPLKVVPCLKDVKRAGAQENNSLKKPVYANVLLDKQTLYTHKLKQKFSADELFLQAQEILRGKPQSVTEKPVIKQASPVQDAHITPAEMTVTSASKLPVSTMDSVDWQAFCRQHEILPGVLKALAQELGLPMDKLNPRQSAMLYHQAYARFVGVE